MCGRFVVLEHENFYPFFDVKKSESIRMNWSYNLAPSQDAGVVVNQEGSNHLITMRWGLTPEWAAKNKEIKLQPINARSEGIFEKGFFRSAIKKRRCIVPATGFYEWTKENKQKIPHFIQLKIEPYMSLAGIYEDFGDAGGKPFRTFAIVTKPANSFMKKLHDRMPIMLNGIEEDWLEAEEDEKTIQKFFAHKSPTMEEYEVSVEVNSPGNNNESLLQKVNK